MEQVQNNQLILVSGYSSTGKSSSLRNLREPEKWMYLNCEGSYFHLEASSKNIRFQIHIKSMKHLIMLLNILMR